MVEKKDVDPNTLAEKENISAEPKDKLIRILIEMQQEQKKSYKAIKLLLAFSALVLAALFIFLFCVIVL